MTPIRNLLSDAVRYGLAAGVGIAGLASASAFAQTAPATDATKAKNLDRVEVLGSRIKRSVDTEPTSPVTTLTRHDIEQTGLTSTFDIISHITASDGSGLSTVTTQTNGSNGSQNISLRNLGAQRTLILVDGKRWPADITGVVDVSSIPVAIIERIEVLKDGASTIYGTDAIAGVINIITRKKYEGAQAGWSYGQTSHGDGAQESEDITIGANGERSNAVVSLSRSKQSSIFAGDRSRTHASIFGCDALLSNYPASDPFSLASYCGSSSGAFGRIGLKVTATGQSLGTWALNNSFTDSGVANGDPNSAVATAPGTKFADFHPFTGTDRYNFAPVNYLQQPAVRNNLYAAGRFDITDSVSAYARASYTQRQSSQQLAQVPDGLGRTSFGPQWNFEPTADNIFNPFTAAGLTVTQLRYRNVAVGPRHNNYDFNTLGTTGGLQGSFAFGSHNFDWDVYAQYNSERDTTIGEHYINLFNLKKALGPSFADAAGLHCGTYNPAAPQNGAIAGCTPFNIFGGPSMGVGNSYTRADSPDPANPLKYTVTPTDVQNMINYVSYTLNSNDGNKGYNFGGNISGEIAPLQGGMLQFAAGVESRRNTSFFSPDALEAGGGSSNNFTSPSSGQTRVDEEYFELNAPLLKGVPGAQELELDAAVRHSRNKASGLVGLNNLDVDPGSPTNKKYSLRWKPITDLLVRASYGDTFRAPSVNDLFAGASENFPLVTDLCDTAHFGGLSAAGQARCLNPPGSNGVPPGGGPPSGSAQARGLSGGNPGLKPEHGHDFTAGAVWSPSFAPGLNVTADYWRINLKDALVTDGAQAIMDQCIFGDAVAAGIACPLINRNPATGELNDITTRLHNAATLKVDGIDTGITYRHEFGGAGTFGVKWDTTYTMHNKQDNTEFVGIFAGVPNWRWRSVATFDWTRGDWDASWTMRYVSHLDEAEGCNVNVQNSVPLICNHPGSNSSNPTLAQGNPPSNVNNGIGGFNRIGAVVYHDVQIGWKAPWKAHLTLGARNVFGKEPPLVNSTFAQSFDASYDLPGGPFYYFQYRQDF